MNNNNKFCPALSNEARRDIWVAQVLRRIPNGKRLIDVGAGTQRYRINCEHLHYTSQDFGKYDGVGDRSGLQTGGFNYGNIDLLCDIASIPVENDAFDVVLCTEVLEHVPSPEKALAEIARILRPGGELVLTAPFTSYTHFSPYHFCTGFSQNYYRHHLPSLGFEILEISPNGDFFDLQSQELARLEAIAVQYTGKKLGCITKIARSILLRSLAKLSLRGHESWIFACQGLHVRAKKI